DGNHVNPFFSRQYRLKKGLLWVKTFRCKRPQSLPGEGALGKGAKKNGGPEGSDELSVSSTMEAQGSCRGWNHPQRGWELIDQALRVR
ncbi:MAG TPA: hypothetical protein VFG95_08945, partial [Nitrospiria bacterium]|nr:hypothetical protein [Nitrospiria bacterium]